MFMSSWCCCDRGAPLPANQASGPSPTIRRAQFIFDFYEFTNRRRVVHNGQVVKTHGATKSQTDNPTKSMWIVEGDSPYDGRFVADVQFEKE